MQRYKITIEYDGRPYVGWQAQENGRSVQETIETAIEQFCGERLRITSAGRTDAGVHATGMVADFAIERPTTPKEVFGALNHHLRAEAIAILAVEPVAADFSARFSARRRHYSYHIVNRRAPLALQRGRAWHVIAPLDAGAMHAAAQRLVGKHDFTTFRHVHCQARSPVRTLDFLCVERARDKVILHAAARSFLHHQLRSIMGTLKLVGEGKWSADDVTAALEARDRQALRMNAPPDGLYFTGVDY